jgi:hypothetical protein
MMAFLKEIRQRILVKRSRVLHKGITDIRLIKGQVNYLKEFSFINPQQIIIAMDKHEDI